MTLCKDAEKKAVEFKKFHETIRKQIEKTNEAYTKRVNKHRKPITFKKGDLVWVHLRKERFPQKRRSKLAPRADGPFEVIAKMGDNAYRVDLPSEYGGVSATFNVGDLSKYHEGDFDSDLRSNPLQEEEIDENQAINPSPSQSPIGLHTTNPITHGPTSLCGPKPPLSELITHSQSSFDFSTKGSPHGSRTTKESPHQPLTLTLGVNMIQVSLQET